MSVKYRKTLEDAARQMILIHDPYLLIKLILKTVVKNIDICHAGILFYNSDRGKYSFAVASRDAHCSLSRKAGEVSTDNPLIRYFNNGVRHQKWGKQYLLSSQLDILLERQQRSRDREFFEKIQREFVRLKADACIPCYFHKELLGVAVFGRKNNNKDFTTAELGFLSVLSLDVAMALKNAWLFKNLKSQVEKNRELFLNMMKVLSGAIEAKDSYTLGHTERVTEYALSILEEIYQGGLIDKKTYLSMKEDVRIAGILHDIGKIGIPEHILNKRQGLTQKERTVVHRHPLIGYNMIKPIRELKNAAVAVKYHHEYYNGRGYPQGMRGKDIPLIASIIAVADCFDAMTSERPYRKSLAYLTALREIMLRKGTQYNPFVVDAFASALKKKGIITG